jgi:hypothetical protein
MVMNIGNQQSLPIDIPQEDLPSRLASCFQLLISSRGTARMNTLATGIKIKEGVQISGGV